MKLLVWTLAVPLATAAIGGAGGPRKFKDAVLFGGLLITFALCLATARQFLGGDVPAAFGDALRVDGLSALVLVLCGFGAGEIDPAVHVRAEGELARFGDARARCDGSLHREP